MGSDVRRATVLRSVGAVFLPAAVFLSGCPQTCAPAPAPPAPPLRSSVSRPPAPRHRHPVSRPPPEARAAARPSRRRVQRPLRHRRRVRRQLPLALGDAARPRGGPQHHQTAEGDHGHAPAAAGGTCGAAQTTTRTITLGEPTQQIYWCDPDGPAGPSSGHIMTATPYTGYGILSFTPNRAFNNISTVCWDQNLNDLGGRRWTNIAHHPGVDVPGELPALRLRRSRLRPGHDVGAANLDAPPSSDTIKVFAGSCSGTPGRWTMRPAGSVPRHTATPTRPPATGTASPTTATARSPCRSRRRPVSARHVPR